MKKKELGSSLPLGLDHPAVYRIKIQGQIRESWSTHFGGMDISTRKVPGDGKISIIQGVITDQTALHGILNRIRDLGLPLLEVKYISKN